MRTTPTLAICVAAGIAAGIALARPAPTTATTATTPSEAAVATEEAAHDVVPAPAPATTSELAVVGFAFPAELVVAPGTAVTIDNRDQAPHTVVADDGSFATDVVDPGGTAAITAPATPGTYAYACTIHPSMTGRLVVQG